MISTLQVMAAVIVFAVCLLALIFGALNMLLAVEETYPNRVKIYLASWVLLFPLMALASLLLSLYQFVQILRLILSARRRKKIWLK